MSVGVATLPNSMFLSSTINVVVSSVVVVPLTVKSPVSTKSPAIVVLPVVNAIVTLSSASPNFRSPFSSICIRCTFAVKKSKSSLSSPLAVSALINVSWSISLTPPSVAHAVPSYPSNATSVELKRI